MTRSEHVGMRFKRLNDIESDKGYEGQREEALQVNLH